MSTTETKLESGLPALLSIKQAAELCGCGERTLWRWSRSGVAPKPVKLGAGTRAAKRYQRDTLLEWIRQGCPRVDG
jgi:predicted DNA-binding transcriptional regulator AlpA